LVYIALFFLSYFDLVLKLILLVLTLIQLIFRVFISKKTIFNAVIIFSFHVPAIRVNTLTLTMVFSFLKITSESSSIWPTEHSIAVHCVIICLALVYESSWELNYLMKGSYNIRVTVSMMSVLRVCMPLMCNSLVSVS
jgi:hypothetical protein